MESAARGYSAIIVRTLCKWSRLVVTPEGFRGLRVFDGDTADVTTLEEIVDKIENSTDEVLF